MRGQLNLRRRAVKAFGRGVGRGAACLQKAPGAHSCRHLCPERLSVHAFWLFESNVAGRQPGCRNRRHGRIHEHHFDDLAADADAPKNAGTRDEPPHDCVNRSFAVFKRGIRGAYQVEFGLGLCGRGGYDGSSCGGRRPATGDSRDGDGEGEDASPSISFAQEEIGQSTPAAITTPAALVTQEATYIHFDAGKIGLWGQ